jgi:hypothetical protein
MYKIKSSNLFLIKLLILSVFFQGWFIAIFKHIGIQGGVSYGSIITYLLYFPVIFNKGRFTIKNRFTSSIFLLIFVFAIFVLLKLSIQSPQFISAYSFNRSINYILPMFLFFIPQKLYEKEIYNIVRFLNILINVAIVIGILQPILFGIIPDYFVDPPLVVSDDVFAQSRIRLGNIIFSKPNGLIGNPIEYAVFLMISLIFKLFFIKTKSKVEMFFIILLLTVNFLIFSRFSTVFAFLLLLIYWVKVKLLSFKKITFFLLGFGLLVILIFNGSEDNPIIDYSLGRITGSHVSAQGSNQEHLKDYNAVLDIISEYPLTGIPIGESFGRNQVITDGAWFKMLLEFGIPLFLLFCFILLLPLINMAMISQKRDKLFIYSFYLFLFLANTVNSGIFCKINYFLLWLLIGLIYHKSSKGVLD